MFNNNKNINKVWWIILIFSIILAIFATITIDISLYSKNRNSIVIELNENVFIKNIFLNNNEISLNEFKNENVFFDERSNVLKCKNNSIFSLNISYIDDILINFDGNTDDIKIQFDGEYYNIVNNSFSREANIFLIIKNSFSEISIIIFFISLILEYIIVNIFFIILKRIKKDNVRFADVLLLIFSVFMIYLSSIYVLIFINVVLGILPLLVLLVVFYLYISKNIKNWCNVYLYFAATIGLIVLFLLPPFDIPDEISHYRRSYSIFNTEVKNSEEGVSLPQIIENLEKKSINIDTQKKYSIKTLFIELLKDARYSELIEYNTAYENVKYLSVLPYLPSAIINFFGKLINIPFLLLFLITRLINFTISTILCYYAIKNTPKFKKLFVLLCLLPIFIQQSIGINNDYITNAICIFFIALILKYKNSSDHLSLKKMIYLSFLGIIISLCKFGYFPILLLIFIIPNQKFKSRRIAILFKLILFIIPFIITIYINIITIHNTNIVEGNYSISTAINDPINVVKMYIVTFLKRFQRDVFIEVINVFGWMSKRHKEFILWTIASIYIIMLFVDDESDDISLKVKDRIMFFCIFIVIYAIIYLAGYTWTSLNSNFIGGIQSRYCLPILPLFYIAISNNMLKLNVKNKYRFYIILLSIVQVLSVTSILIGFY